MGAPHLPQSRHRPFQAGKEYADEAFAALNQVRSEPDPEPESIWNNIFIFIAIHSYYILNLFHINISTIIICILIIVSIYIIFTSFYTFL